MNEKKYTFRTELRDFLYILSGSFFLAAGLVFFLIPNKIVTGGVAGLAIVLHYLIGFPTGMIMLVLNIPLILIGWRYLGKLFLLKTVFAIITASFLTDLFIINLHLQQLTSQLMLATIYGGIAVGVGLGLIFKGNASAGGGTVVARVISKKSHFKIGQILFALDVLVILTAAITFRNVELALWGFLTIFIASQLVDLILTGKPAAKVAVVETNQITLISQRIYQDLGRTITIIPAKAFSTGESKELLLVIIDSSQVNKLRDIVKFLDPQATVIISDARELLGNGF
ncbi:MAG: hypothetical protein A2Y94_09195 [Caldithrix sp. RBG_13_44_9]|nr:MAG: hypothetical protein A2Y94_09195 [Caldithrix sp. RBG_13_44_9]